ncbi:MAG: GNAT family N-acetyltransferase [Myxococcales bacterium]|nr:GNAT family N-acetyltransferase [Myxococcales bacterium]
MRTPSRERIARISERTKKKEGLSFRTADISNLPHEIDTVHRLFTKAWEKNWGFAPFSKKEFEWICEDIATIAIPELILFAMVDGKEVGFVLTVPNVNENMPRSGRLLPFGWLKLLRVKKTKHARLYLLGVVPEYRRRGLEAVMFDETVRRANSIGIHAGEVGWTLEDNHLINKSIQAMDGTLDRIYRIYGMKLTPTGA